MRAMGRLTGELKKNIPRLFFTKTCMIEVYDILQCTKLLTQREGQKNIFIKSRFSRRSID